MTQFKATTAGVAFSGDLELAYRVCLWSRVANRVLLVLSQFEVKTQHDLYAAIQEINWFEHINAEDSFAVTFSAKNSTVIVNSHFGALKSKMPLLIKCERNLVFVQALIPSVQAFV